MKILNKTRSTVIATHTTVAATLRARMTGLLNYQNLPEGEALIITQCQSIHMFFMRFAIDAIFVSKENCVVGLVRGIRPNRLSPIFFKANYVIELPEGTIADSKTEVGDQIELEKSINC